MVGRWRWIRISRSVQLLEESMSQWTHFTIDDALPGKAWGTGGIGLADFTGDGQLEVAVSRRETKTVY